VRKGGLGMEGVALLCKQGSRCGLWLRSKESSCSRLCAVIPMPLATVWRHKNLYQSVYNRGFLSSSSMLSALWKRNTHSPPTN